MINNLKYILKAKFEGWRGTKFKKYLKYIEMLKNKLMTFVWSNDLQHNKTVDRFLILGEYLIPLFARVASNHKNKIANTKHLSHFHLVSSECPKINFENP